jgi:hypothetical protein
VADGIRVAPLDGSVSIEVEAGGKVARLKVTAEYAATLAKRLEASAKAARPGLVEGAGFDLRGALADALSGVRRG